MSPTPDRTIAILGPFGPPQLACLRSWQRLGWRVALLHSDDAELGPASRRCFDYYRFVGPASGLGHPELVRIGDYLANIKASALVCVAEALAIKLGSNRSCFPPQLKLLINHPETLDRLVSKLHQIDAARQSGFRVLPSWKITATDQATLDELDYPVVVRPDRPETMQPLFKAEVLHTRAEARRFLESMAPGCGAVVVQRFISGPGLVIHGSRSLSGELSALTSYLVLVKHQGVSVSLRPIHLSEATLAACRVFVERENVIGVFHFDLMRDSGGNEWFLELNARMGGTTAKVYASGLDEPAHLLASHGLLSFAEQPANVRLSPVISRIAALKCLRSTLGGKASMIDYPYPKVATLLSAIAKGCIAFSDEVLSPSSPATTFAYLFPKR